MNGLATMTSDLRLATFPDESNESPPGLGLRQSSGALATVNTKHAQEKRQRTGAVQNAFAQ
jgi:hypothetical protein